MKKEIEVSAKFDNSDFDRKIEKMKRDLRDLYQMPDLIRSQNSNSARMGQAGMGNFSPMNPGNSAHQRAQADQSLMQMHRTNEAAARALQLRMDSETRITKILKENNNLSKEEISLYNQKLDASRKITEEERKRLDIGARTVNQALNARDQEQREVINTALNKRGARATGGMDFDESGGGGGPRRPGSAFNSWAKTGGADAIGAVMSLAKTASAVMALAAAGTALITKYYGMPISTVSSSGGATKGMLGEEMGNIGSGDTTNINAFAGQRSKAYQMARDANQGSFLSNVPTSTSQIFPWMAGGFKKGMGGDDSALDNFYAAKAKTQSDDYNTALQGMKDKDQNKIAAQNYYTQNKSRDLSMQRQLGLNYNTYHGPGGYMESATGGGAFPQQTAVDMSQSIMGSGGSTQMGRSPLGAMQLQSGMNLTNAGSILGKVSGQTGNAGLAQQITERMLEEAVRRGFSKSEFTEEFRQFADMAGTIIANSGARNVNDAGALTQGFGRFVGDNITPGGLTGAKSAYDEYQSQTSQTSGRMGGIQYAEMQSDPLLGQLGTLGIGGLMEKPDQDLTEDSTFIKSQAEGLSRKTGKRVTARQLADAVRDAKRKTDLASKRLDPGAVDKVNNYLSDKGLDGGDLTESDLSAMPSDIFNTYKQTQEAGVAVGEYGGNQKEQARSRGTIKGFGGGGGGGGGTPYYLSNNMVQTPSPADQIAANKAAAQAGTTGKQEDINQQNIGQANLKSLENFRDYAKGFDTLGKSMDTFFGKLFQYNTIMQGMSDGSRAFMLTGTGGGGAQTQPQGAKPPGGGSFSSVTKTSYGP